MADAQGLGASASPSGSRPSDQAPAGLDAVRFDPSRRHLARKAATCDLCGAAITVGDHYIAGRAKVSGWKTRFGVEHICLECAK